METLGWNIMQNFLFLLHFELISGRPQAENDPSEKFSAESKKAFRSMVENTPRIVGGKQAPKNGYPSVVSLYYYGGLVCAGTIISEEWIVSAAHCVFSDHPSRFSFTAGDHSIRKTESTEQEVDAIAIYKHENYNSNTYRNDIVLFKVSPPLKMNKNVKSADLPDPDLQPTGMATVVGWGRTKEGGDESDVLLHVDVPIITNDRCKDSYSKIYPQSLCAGFDSGGKDACQGDSGGPLYLKKSGKQILIGIVSNGRGCARENYPGIYTRVSKFRGWMKNIIDNDSSAGHSHGPLAVEGATIKRMRISAIMSESICKQYDEFIKDHKIPPPNKKKPKSNIRGVFGVVHCSTSFCKPFKLLRTKD